MWRTGQRLLDFLFPPRCPGCWQIGATQGFCNSCSSAVLFLRSPLCTICGTAFDGSGDDHPCARCLGQRPSFQRARAGAAYEDSSGTTGAIAAALQRYKYGPDVTLAPFLGNLLADLCPYTGNHDMVLPVPLHISRLRWRGFNQSLLLARSLAKRSSLPIDPSLLVRSRATIPQVGLSESERRRNTAGAFAVTQPGKIRRRSVLLIDDVYTTGATLNECAKTLRRAGARRVDALVLLRAGIGA